MAKRIYEQADGIEAMINAGMNEKESIDVEIVDRIIQSQLMCFSGEGSR